MVGRWSRCQRKCCTGERAAFGSSGTWADEPNPPVDPTLTTQARTLPGQVSPEVVKPPTAPLAAPIPARSGLALPSAPRGAELSELPSPNVASTSQADALAQPVKRGT